MKERMIMIQCPHCGHSFQIKRDTLTIAGMNSVIDQRLENGSHFTHVCQKCHEPFYMMAPFMYRDPKKKYILILSGQSEFSNLPKDEKVIVCKSVPQFLLAYKICSQQLNFSLVLQKKKLMDQRYGNTKFDGYDSINHCLWFSVQDEKKAVLLNETELVEIQKELL